MLQNKSSIHVSQKASGFTLVELLIVAPIVILVIAAFIGTVLTLTGSVLATKTAGTLAFNIQDALNRIEQDTRQSGAFLATNNITLTTPQGYDNGTSNFNNSDSTAEATNADGKRDSSLILNAYATTANPISVSNITPIPAANQPNACASTSVAQNTLVYINIVYFVKNNTLWRRVITPSNYSTVPCSTPWQQGSCASSVVSTYPSVCKTNDIDLVDNIIAGGFAVNYLPASSSTLPDSVAVSPYPTTTAATRQAALHNDTTVTVSITASQIASGHTVTQSGTILGISNNNDTTATVAIAAPTTPVTTQPTPTTVAAGTTATFTSSDAPSGVSEQWQQSTDLGVTWSNVSGATSTTLSVTPSSVYWNLYQYRAVFTNSAGSATSNAVSMTVTTTGWTTLAMQNGWNDFGIGTFDSGAFRMTSSGLIVIKGVEQKSGSVVAGEVLGSLPLGYAPNYQLLIENSSNQATGRIDIYTNGIIELVGGSNAWFTLDGVSFYPSAYTSISTASPWVNYGGPYAPLSYYQSPDLRVSLRGLVAGGAVADGTPIATLPASTLSPSSIAPSLYEHIGEYDGGYGGEAIGLSASPTRVEAKGYPSNSYVSTNALYYPSNYPASGTNCGLTTYVLSSGWCPLTLQNSWVAYGGAFSTPRYTKSSDNMVLVKGLIKSGTTTAATVIATLPSGFRPAAEVIETIAVDSASTGEPTWGRVDILPSGNIITESVSASWTSLDSVQFYADGS